jgi:SAM-dependent methyltransferase
METKDKEKIRQAVRENYANIAKSVSMVSGIGDATPCCGSTQNKTTADSQGSCCSPQHVSNEQLNALMGYTRQDLASVPEGANMGLGCGNPVALASLKFNETVVDLGAGSGFDCFLAAKQVGDGGKVIGVDMTPDMLTTARMNAEKIGATNVEFRLGEIEHLPVADNSVDIIMSNCVINLSPDKLKVYRDAYRVLKPGGRLAIADIVTTAPLPEKIRENMALVTACVGGAATIEDTRKMLQEAGFVEIKVAPKDKSRELIQAWDPQKSDNAGDYVVSAYIEAVKPL